MDGYINVTLDLRRYADRVIDIAVNEKMSGLELVSEVFKSLYIDNSNLASVMLTIKRNGYVITGAETLQSSDVRNGDVLLLK